MSALTEFCEERKITKNIKEAFETYCRSSYASQFHINKDGETARLIVSKMTGEQVEEAWNRFVVELKKFIA